MSPQGDRARSRIELSILMNRDLSSFEYKSGVFSKNGLQRLTLQRRKRKTREHSASELVADQTSDSSFVERGEGADTPDSYHRLTPTVSAKPAASPTLPQIKNETPPPNDNKREHPDDKIRLPGPTSSKPLYFPSINGEFGPADSILVCSRCGLTFTGTWYDKQRKNPFCPSCWAFKTKEHPLIRFRKWIPCGQCAGCHNKVNCGHCSNCKGLLPGSRKRTCRKRKCLCPIRKGPGGFITPKPNIDPEEDSQEFTHYQHLNTKSEEPEDFTTPLELDEDDDMSSDDDEDWHKRRRRRACGECPACLRKDCGTCDFCIDKPKFGGSNKKDRSVGYVNVKDKQWYEFAAPLSNLFVPNNKKKSRFVRTETLATFSVWGDADDATIWGRTKPQYTYSRKRKRVPPSEDEDEDKDQQTNSSSKEQNVRKHQSSMQLNNSVYGQQNGVSVKDHHNSIYNYNLENRSQTQVEDEEEDYPTITQIYSLADEPSDLNKEHDLMKMLDTLRSSALPILWYAIMVEGPQMQLVQCSKLSAMADTTVQIDTDFNYKISVQRHPLLPLHPLYDAHPSRLDSITHVVNLLLDMDKYIVCHGVPPTQAVLRRNPIILERAPTCEFLIKKNETICTNCRMLCE
uniref:CXXC-type domain-containing protein n=1 Tax=Neogobius melanostomus TaxID=47308 RepID=A0A8C6WXT1_9GOBI